MKTWFTADWHLGHENIIKFCKRPFKDVQNMNHTIIKRHNERVKIGDTVFYLGDFCFRNTAGGKRGEGTIHRAEYYIRQLNGNFVFIKGTHDKNNTLKTKIEKVIIKYGGNQICLVHNPIHADTNYEFNFVAHVHNKWEFKRIKQQFDFTDLINVGIDVWNFYPVTFEEIMHKYKQWKKNLEN